MTTKTALCVAALAITVGASTVALGQGAALNVDTVVKDLFEPYSIVVDRSTTNNYYYISERADGVGDRVIRYQPGLKRVAFLTDNEGFDLQGIVLLGQDVIAADAGHHRILRLRAQTPFEVIAGTGQQGATDGIGGAAQFSTPSGLATDGTNVFVADSKNNAIRKLTPMLDNLGAVTNWMVSTFAKGPFRMPTAVAVSPEGYVFVADTGNSVIRVVAPDGSIAPDVIPGFNAPRGLCYVGGKTGLLVSDTFNHTVKRAFTAYHGGTLYWQVEVVAGTDMGFVDGPAESAKFFEPMGLATDLDGAIVVADLKNNKIRRIKREQISALTMKPAGGTFTNAVEVTVASLTPDVELRYTTNGDDPTFASPMLPTPLTLDGGPVGLKVRGFSPDYASSEVVSNNFQFGISPLQVSHPSGFYTNDVFLQVSCPTPNVIIRASTNDVPPLSATDTNSFAWTDRMWGQSGTIHFAAFRDGYTASPVVSQTMHFTVAQPILYPPGIAGPALTTNRPVVLRIECGTDGADLWWCFAPRRPQPPSSPSHDPALDFSVASGAPFILATNGLVQVQAFKPGYEDSMLVSATYNLIVDDPVIDPKDGKSSDNVVPVTITCETPESQVFYTLDGTDPLDHTAANVFLSDGKTFNLGTNALLRARAYRPGFVPSATVAARFDLKVATPLIVPPGMSNILENDIEVTLNNNTLGAKMYYAVGRDPVPDTAWTTEYTNTFLHGRSGNLQVVGYRDGFVVSAKETAIFNFKVGQPTIEATAFTNSEPVVVTLGTITRGASLYWTINGATPTTSDTLYTGPFPLATTGTLRVKGFKDGYESSGTESAEFNLFVAPPTVTPASMITINSNQFSMVTNTSLSEIYYTIDGSEPATSAVGSTRLYLKDEVIPVTTNTVVKAIGVRAGFKTSSLVQREYTIKVDAPIMNPKAGYYPDGAFISFETLKRADGQVYYTLDGSEPTTSSIKFDGKAFKLSAVNSPGTDLRAVRARAFAPNTEPSDIVTGDILGESQIGVSRETIPAGVGSTVLVPIVVNLKTNDVIKSIQYRVLATPQGAAPKFTAPLDAISFGTNDFVSVYGDQAYSFSFQSTAYTIDSGAVTTNALDVFVAPTNTNLKLDTFGVVGMIAVSIPTTAQVGQQYTIEVANASGTSDSAQHVVPLDALPARTILVTNIAYVVGDTAPGDWYNAGDFGNDELDNADVNNVYFAAMGIRTPPPYTDAFDAMDAFPEDTADVVGGDGQIRFLDWNLILMRALRHETENWKRAWTNNGVRTVYTAALNGAPQAPSRELDGRVVGQIWPDGAIAAGNVGEVSPGQWVSVPVDAKVLDGRPLVGLQFKSSVMPVDGAPALEDGVVFQPSAVVSVPMTLPGLPTDTTIQAWTPLRNPLPSPIAGKTRLGYLHFRVPSTAVDGQTYQVNIGNADGSPDMRAQSDLASQGGSVVVGQPAPATGGEAVRGFRLRWQGIAGQQYMVESTSDLAAGQWQVVAEHIAGLGRAQEFVDQQGLGEARFYRIRPQD